MKRLCTGAAVALLGLSCTPHLEQVDAPVEPIPEAPEVQPVAPPSEAPATTWAVPIGNAGVQSPGAIAVAPDGTTFTISSMSFGCTEVTEPSPDRLCHRGPGVLGIDLLVAHERTGELRFARRVDDPERWSVLDVGVLADGRVALLTAPRRELHGEPPMQKGFTRPTVRIVDPTDGTQRENIELDVDAAPGIGSLLVMPDDDLVVSGSFIGELRVGARKIHGGEDEDVFIARLDRSGHARWVSTARGDMPGLSGQDRIGEPRLLSDGSIAVVGSCRGNPLRFEGGSGSASMTCGGKRRDDAFVAKWNGDGTLVWARHIRGTMSGSKWIALGAEPYTVVELADHSLMIAGIFSHKVAFESPSKTIALASRGFADIFLARYDASGELADAWQVGGAGNDRVAGLQPDGDAVWVIGETAGAGVLGGSWAPSRKFVNHDPKNLHLVGQGFLVRFDPASGTRHVVTLRSDHPSHVYGTSPEEILGTRDHLFVAGTFADDRASFPLFGEGTDTITRRVEPRMTYESFLWGIAWDALHARIARFPEGGAIGD